MPIYAANALVSDLVSGARDFLNDPSPNGRWTDTALIRLANRAMKILNRDIEFPQARWDIPVVPGQATYNLSPVPLSTDAVYVNGQPLPASTKKIMAGAQIGAFDQAGSTVPTATGIEIPGGAATAQYVPSWIAQGPANYPVTQTGLGGLASPFYGGQRPVYYLDSGYLGIEPAPLAGIITMWGTPVVPDNVALSEGTLFPTNCITALVWKMCEIAKFSDDSDRAADGRNYAASQYEREMRDLRVWNRRRTGDDNKLMIPRTRRSQYVKGNNRVFTSNGYGNDDS